MALNKKGVKFTWGIEQQEAFKSIKRKLAQQILLHYPDPSKPFEVYTDASKLQLGLVITQGGAPIAFFSKMLSTPQQSYPVIKLELLSIVETLKTYQNILLGHEVIIYTDHKNLSYVNFASDQIR